MKRQKMNTYSAVAFQWYAGDKKPSGFYYSHQIRATSQKDARRQILDYTCWEHDEKTVRLASHAWKNNHGTNNSLYLMDIKR